MITFTLPEWFPLMAFYFLIAGLCGLWCNYLNLHARGAIHSSLYRYLFVIRPGRTFASLLSLVAATFAAVAIGGLEDMKMTTAVAAGFTSGWAIDAGVNRGKCDLDPQA